MRHGPLPLTFEDRTAHISNTDFDDMYDRLFFHVVRQPGRATTKIYQMSVRASRHRSTLPIPGEALIHLDFGADESLGTISFFKSPLHGSIPMSRYLKKTGFFASSLSRKFMGSDGREYKWGYRLVPGQEWTCTTMDNCSIVAHYDLKPPNVRIFDTSGNNLIIYEAFTDMIPEIIASFIIMRHIAQFNL
ncbi:hypothetical protein HYPSUDRAFT_47720 [Hypholoma sublateritium FD-334 SS-4]|uniref:DUF6593 domain-containing protein n=1 Tax=Hypholoma sublateritium (strain FD-334 SS-4) TaxID=945553 RepID=A0A0D2LYW9_HYPSF|nr:hypothetical protein HYPSUDRAFT_47720 [Hypholoma sublateritium FD-334 SS-4]